MSETIRFTLDGRKAEARPGETIWQVARRMGTTIPHLCWRPEPGYRADGNCRACMVEIEGERVLAASCIRKPTEGMVVRSASARAVTARRLVMELLAGRSLRTVIQEDGPLPFDRVVRLIGQLAIALDHAHRQGIAHRDVKAANAFVGPSDQVTLVDFGIARWASCRCPRR